MAGSLPSRSRRRERLPSGWRRSAFSCMGTPQIGRPEYDTRSVQNPPPPPPPGPQSLPAGGGAMAMPGNLASPWLRLVGGLIDLVILASVAGVSEGCTQGLHIGSAAGCRSVG